MVNQLQFLVMLILYGISFWAFVGICIEMIDKLLTIIQRYKR